MHGSTTARRVCLFAAMVVAVCVGPAEPGAASDLVPLGGCPEVKSGPAGTPGHVVQRYFDAFGCEVPLRTGQEHPDDRWGFDHIEHRCKAEGDVNHCLDGAQRQRILATLVTPTFKCPRPPPKQTQVRYYLHYQDGAKNRTMVAIAERAGYAGLGPQGIRTAYWERGHRKGCP